MVGKYVLTAAEVEMVVQACRTADELDRLERAVRKLPDLTTTGSTGQLKPHPLLAEGTCPPATALKSSSPVLRNPANRNRAVPLTFEQFGYSFGNAVSEEEAKQLYEDFAVPASGKSLFQAAAANLNPWTEAKVDTKNPDRGPLLLISGELDHTVPWAIVNASYKEQQDNPGVTEIEKIPGHGHALVIDSGWREVADTALAFVKRFT